ncbi:TonB-dependent receptor [Aquincola sp. S2]|uniref:TonB-dependent receptor n=1 Tax=Pseudaquabacterium terrae TaxID=2732868 RepID=A0ABX2EBP1_9BURK|nr:TonB-dependent receptor [Aquabacterium terrae]NRF65819.1 TonB-dependent receptor [Aquabacterium terrae]
MRQLPATLAPLLLAAAVHAAYAQTSTSTTDPKAEEKVQTVITTGTRTAKAVDKIPGAITVIGKEEVQNTLALTEDASAVLARSVPGYSESSQAMSNTGETLRGRIPLRLFDGVPQGSPLREGTRNATFTDMGVVGRIEVINGPSASEGIGAAGGIINYISKTPTKPGDEFQVVSRYSTQFKDDSDSWKLGFNYAHKDDRWDLLASVAHIDRGISYDGNGRRIGLNTSGSVADSKANNVFVKGGVNFGTDNDQRIQASLADFKITGKGNYHLVDGDRNLGITNTSLPGAPLGAKTEFNDFQQTQVSYDHANLGGGQLSINAYVAKQAMRYPAESGEDRQDPLIAPLGTLIDQSEIRAKKQGLRTAWSRQDIFGLQGLELRTGVDVVRDEADQRLALTDRLWVPPMIYKSVAPYGQLSYEVGPLTVSGGLRREDGELHVDSYTTTYFRNRVAVQGGTLDYTANLSNLGAVLKLPAGWSTFVSVGKGFTLPNVGIPLRNVNQPGQSVQGILDLQAIIVKNQEIGLNWRGKLGSFSASYYDSKSDLGVSLSIDPVTNDFVMNRLPVRIKGLELSGELNVAKDWRFNGLYSRIRGKTWFTRGGPLDREMGVNDINPDKLALSGTWKFLPGSEVTLGATTLFSRDINVGKPAGEEHTKGYTLVDFSVDYEAGRWGKFTLGIENLTDKFYILSWSQVVGFRNYWSGRGRVVSISHTLTF